MEERRRKIDARDTRRTSQWVHDCHAASVRIQHSVNLARGHLEGVATETRIGNKTSHLPARCCECKRQRATVRQRNNHSIFKRTL